MSEHVKKMEKAHRWYLDVHFRVVQELKKEVALAFFYWFKEPGTSYVTYFPATWVGRLPMRESISGRYSQATRIMNRAVSFNKPSYTIGYYGGGHVEIPAWTTANKEQVSLFPFDPDLDPGRAAEIIIEKRGLLELRSEGEPDKLAYERMRSWVADWQFNVLASREVDSVVGTLEKVDPHERELLPKVLDEAIKLAVDVHAGQFDKGGAPFILHPLHVMQQMKTLPERIVAVLHDVLEDGGDRVRDQLSEVLQGNLGPANRPLWDALDALHRNPGETYEAFIERASRDPIACHVKLADIEHNLDLTRIPNPGYADYRRMKKYWKAKVQLLEAVRRYR